MCRVLPDSNTTEKRVAKISKWLKQFEELKSDQPQVNVKRPLSVKSREHSSNDRRDKKAKASGFMIGIPGEVYMLSVSKTNTVYIEKIGEQWQAWRETYPGGRQQTVNEKTIAKGRMFEYVLLKARGYFDYIESKRRG